MTNNFFPLQWSGKAHDLIAVIATAFATITSTQVSDALQIVVLGLTIIFLSLGIIMRFGRLRRRDY